MQYYGGKQRISKELCKYLNAQLHEEQPFVDLFCGSCNIVAGIDSNRLRIANDKHEYLIEMWKALQEGWEMPSSITEEEYNYIKQNKDEDKALSGFVGFGCCFAGKWFGGYARGGTSNYCATSKRSNEKLLPTLKDVRFLNKDYRDVDIPLGAMVYCDIPYKGTGKYGLVGGFDHDAFYEWVKNNSQRYDIYISEYSHNVPRGFEIVWSRKSFKSLRDKEGRCTETQEVLMKWKGDK